MTRLSGTTIRATNAVKGKQGILTDSPFESPEPCPVDGTPGAEVLPEA